MKRNRELYDRLYIMLPGLAAAGACIRLLCGSPFWAAYRFLAIGWLIGILLAYFLNSIDGKPAPRFSRYAWMGQLYYIGRDLDARDRVIDFCFEMIALCILGAFTGSFWEALIGFFLMIPLSLLMHGILHVLPVPSLGINPFDSYAGYGGVDDSQEGYGTEPSHVCQDGVRVPEHLSYLDGVAGHTWRHKLDNYRNRP